MAHIFENITTAFFNAFTQDNKKATEIEVNNLFSFLKQNFPYFDIILQEVKDINLVVDTFMKIGSFFNIEFSVVENVKIDDVITQQRIIYTFTKIFHTIQQMNVHQNVKDSKQKTFSCDFHKEELFDHLILASLTTCIKSIGMKLNPFVATLTAILHDIGKPACIHFYSKGHVGYPGHGELAGNILSRIYCRAFEQYISKEDWEIMLRVITTHMCSYHMTEFTSKWNMARVNSARFETEQAKQYSMALSYGDVFSALSNNMSRDDFVSSRDAYWDHITEPFICDKDRMVITLEGPSNVGKTTVAKMLQKYFEDKNISCGYVGRDNVMCDVVHSLTKKPVTYARLVGDDYKFCQEYYKKHGLGKIANINMRSQIRSSIQANKITITDTQMTSYKGATDIIPDEIEDCIIVSIQITRNAESVDDQKNGISIQEQIALTGLSTFLKPINTDAVDMFRLQSKYCSNVESDAFNALATDYCFQIGSNDDYGNSDSIGFTMTTNLLQKIIDVMSNVESGTSDCSRMNLEDYVNTIYQKCGRNYDKLCEFFRKKAYQCGCPVELRDTENKHRFFHIKYLDHNNIWTLAGREARGACFYLEDDDIWYTIKGPLWRGGEVITGLQIERGITGTDNINLSADYKCSNLSLDQQGLIIDLAEKNKPINIRASFKKDGSLHLFTILHGKWAKLFRKIINAHCDEFTNTVMYTYDMISGSDDVLIFQSQGTLFLGNFMQDYATTAIFPNAIPSLTPIQKVKTYGPELFTRLAKLFSSMDGDICHVLAETICAKRTESYSGKVHNELAVNYESSGFTILARTMIKGSVIVREPHYLFSDQIHANGFVEPAYWHVTNSDQMDALVRGVDEYIFNGITVDNFYEQFPPANSYPYEKVIDVEGFIVVYEVFNMQYKMICHFNDKVKSDSYYRAHKLRKDNIEFLCKLALVAGHIFPLAAKIHAIYVGLDKKLAIINKQLLDLIESGTLVTAMPEKAQASFVKQSRPVQFKMLINQAHAAYFKESSKFFAEQFGELNMSDELQAMIISYSMRCEIWRDVPLKIDPDFLSTLITSLAI